MNIFPILLGSLFAFLSTYLAIFGIKYCFDCFRMYQTDRYAPGEVTQIKTEQELRKGRIRITHIAVITYYTLWHEKMEIEYSNPLGTNAFKVGDKLTVWYDVNDPKLFTLGGWHFVKDIASIFIFVVFSGLPGWGILIVTFKQYIHF